MLHSGKRKLSSAAPNPRDSQIRNVRQSAWLPMSSSKARVQFTRKSMMVPCTFSRSVAELDGPKVSFNHSEVIETILVAEDWKEGWEKSLRKEDYSSSGFIGRGTSKRVIYVCSLANLPCQYSAKIVDRHDFKMRSTCWGSYMMVNLPSKILAFSKQNLRTWFKVRNSEVALKI